ncbi:MAG: AAA family ATPase [Alphaproteobacteria bacterium]|nr:AAA family ATPase [Alphaproteobacteria bacterium]
MDIKCAGFELFDLDKFNIILGKNGCGKSHLLKALDAQLKQQGIATVRYISPQRGGLLKYQSNIEQNVANDPNWMSLARRKNQAENFKEQSTTLFRQLEITVLRGIEADHLKPDYTPRKFDDTVAEINTLLDRVKLERDASRVFRIIDKESGQEAPPDQISSGESELISLGIELLAFAYSAKAGDENVILVDEPDVHLHPDLQDRLARFVVSVLADKPVILILATHSTALLAGLASKKTSRVAFMRRKDTRLDFRTVSEIDRRILPIFGAHPLSNVFNQSPVILIEGEDDERVWQQAVRSSDGRLRLFPCVVDGIDNFSAYEGEVNNILEAVYDGAKAFSLRDRDTDPEAIDDLGQIVRARLACRTAENLFLSDDALEMVSISWVDFQSLVSNWLQGNKGHQYHAQMVTFVEEGFDRQGFKLKNIRNILVGLITHKPWEVLAGQAVAKLTTHTSPLVLSEGSLASFLGAKVCSEILGMPIAS